jgi:hypothetical protein
VWDLKVIAAVISRSGGELGPELTDRAVTTVAEKLFCNWQIRHSLHPNCWLATFEGVRGFETDRDCSEPSVLRNLPCLCAASSVVL